MLEYGHAHVNLVVWSQYDAGGDVVADLSPVQVVPEALRQPVEAHLWFGKGPNCQVADGIILFAFTGENERAK